MSDLLLKAFDEQKESLPELNVGDDVTVHVRINVGERNERSQIVRGTVIRVRRSGNNSNFTVRRIASNGVGVTLTCVGLSCTTCANVPVNRRVCGKSGCFSSILAMLRPYHPDTAGHGLNGVAKPDTYLAPKTG